MKAYQPGLQLHDPETSFPGFTLIAPMGHEEAHLIDNHGEVVHTWTLPGALGSKAYLLPNGNLLCSVSTVDGVPLSGEWAHANSASPTLDGNVLVSFRHLDTIAIIDNNTKDIIWSLTDRSWGHQHHADMLPNGNITIFANGMNNLHQPLQSRAIELTPETGEIVWEYIDPQRWTFFSPVMGGVQRLPNGNTLICESLHGRVFEVTADHQMVWDYIYPKYHPVQVLRGPGNALFRAYRYAADSLEIGNRL